MRFGIGAKLGLLASTLIIATVLLLAWLMMSWSKDALTRQDKIPFLVVRGRKGGSAMAVAAVNALSGEAE